MSTRRVKFIWGASKVIRGRWYLGLFGIYDRRAGVPGGGLALSVRGLLAWGLALGGATYVAGATALYLAWERNPYSLLTYGDALFYPLRRAAIAEKRGQAFIAQGTELFRAKQYHDAATYLRLGLVRYPRDRAARLLLARYHTLRNQRALALRVLEEGLGDEFPGRSYLEALFNTAEEGEDFAPVARIAARYVDKLSGENAVRDRRWLWQRRFAALSGAGRHEEALALAAGLGATDTGSEQRILALLALGRADEALQVIAEWRARPGADPQRIDGLEARALREAKRLDEMEQLLARMEAAPPMNPATLAFGIAQRALAGRYAAARQAFERFLFRFGGSGTNLVLAAEVAAEIGDVALLEACVAAAAEHGHPLQRFQMLLVRAHVRHAQWPQASAVLARIQPVKGRDAASLELWRDWLQRLIDAATQSGEGAANALLAVMRARPGTLALYHQSIESLRRSGQLATARDAAAIAQGMFPASVRLQETARAIEQELARAAANAPAAAPARRVAGAGVFFQELDALMREGKWTDVDRILRDARAARPAPSWLATREDELRFIDIKAAHGRGEPLAMVAAAKLYLNGDDARSRQVIELARGYAAAGDRDAGLALVKEVLRRVPDFPPAKRTLAEWQPPAAEPKK